MQAEIESLYEKNLKVLSVFDSEQATELTKEECAALIKILELQSIYFRGCYYGVGVPKKGRTFITD